LLVKENTFEIAKKVYEIVKGNILIVLGQTPAYLGVMVEEIKNVKEKKDFTKIFNILFSGRPNYIRKIVYEKTWETAFLDILTLDREKVFRDILEERFGLHPKKIKDKIFILDNSTGPSIASFLAILKRWFDECNLKMPSICYLHMRDEKDLFIKNEKGKWVKPSSDRKVDLVFHENLRFDIPVIFLGMRDDVLVAFDKVYDNLRIVPSFNAINWRKRYFEEISKDHPSKEAKELILEYRDYVEEHLD
jgi:hypothetical protein